MILSQADPPRSGRTPTLDFPIILSTRHQIEARHGWLSNEPVLAEDGRATRLCDLPRGGALYLSRHGDLLVIEPSAAPDRIREVLLGGGRAEAWTEVESRYPGVRLGSPCLPRYWLLQEPVGRDGAMYGVYDLADWTVLVRGPDRQDIADLVTRANLAGYYVDPCAVTWPPVSRPQVMGAAW